MLHALNDITTATSKGSEATLAAIQYFLNYAASNPDGRIRYTTSEMILQTISDATYLVCPKARSRMGGYHFLDNKNRTLFNSMATFSSSPKSSKMSWGLTPSLKLAPYTSTSKPPYRSELALSRLAILSPPRHS